jgi:hypothetical protein
MKLVIYKTTEQYRSDTQSATLIRMYAGGDDDECIFVNDKYSPDITIKRLLHSSTDPSSAKTKIADISGTDTFDKVMHEICGDELDNSHLSHGRWSYFRDYPGLIGSNGYNPIEVSRLGFVPIKPISMTLNPMEV